MKELTIEQKAQRYDEAIETTRKWYDANTNEGYRGIFEEIFPELKESEDERIRKAIHIYLDWLDGRKDYAPKGEYTIKDMIAWIEKQGKHQKFRDSIQVGDKVTRNKDGVLVNLSQIKRVAKPAEEQGEQKPADKVEPKFKVGDWVVTDKNNVVCIKSIDNVNYVLNNTMRFTIDYVDKCWHLWTIQDAKDGDVLFTSSTASHETFIFKNIDEKGNVKCYFTYDSEDGFREGKYHFIGRATYCKPATKEQRDLLFQKMKEAGYEWDAEKKELKKIEQKPAWSEEDEKIIEEIINDIECARAINYHAPKEGYEFRENWLKSLKQRI